MRIHSSIPSIPHRIVARLITPELTQLSSHELHELFLRVGKQFEQSRLNEAESGELHQLQFEIAAIKDELHRKANLTPESSFRANYFSLSLEELS